MSINDLTNTIQSIKDAKEDLRGAINAKGGTLSDDAKLSEFKDAVEGLPSGGDDSKFDSLLNRTIERFEDANITDIKNYAFCYCENLKKIVCPNVRTLKIGALSYTTSLLEVDLLKLSSVEALSLSYSGIKRIDFPMLKIYKAQCFRYNKKATVAIITDATELQTLCFDNCIALSSLIIHGDMPRLINISALNYTPIAQGKGNIYVEDSLVDSYKTATNWSTYAAQIKPLSEYTES